MGQGQSRLPGTGASNVIPGHLEVDFNFRFSPESPPERLRQRVESLLIQHEVEFDLEWTLGAQPFLCQSGKLLDALRDAIMDTTGRQPVASTTGGTSDGRFIATLCPQVVEFGPCNGSIHMVDENVLVKDLDLLQQIYRSTLDRLLLPAAN